MVEISKKEIFVTSFLHKLRLRPIQRRRLLKKITDLKPFKFACHDCTFFQYKLDILVLEQNQYFVSIKFRDVKTLLCLADCLIGKYVYDCVVSSCFTK